MNPYKVYISLVIVFSLFTLALLALNPSYADILFDEYGIVELSGVGIVCLAALLAIILAWKGYKDKTVWGFWIGLAALSFLFVGETLSWGEKIFNINMPRIAGIKFDALHDILSVSIGIMKKTRDFIMEIGILDPRSIGIIASVVLITTILLLIIINFIFKYRENIIKFFKKNLQKAPFRFLFIALIMIAISMIVDDDNLVQFPHKEIVDEGLELLAVVGFLFSSICGLLKGKWGFAKKRIM